MGIGAGRGYMYRHYFLKNRSLGELPLQLLESKGPIWPMMSQWCCIQEAVYAKILSMARKTGNTVHITLRLPRPILTQIDAIAYENLHSRNQELVKLVIRGLERAEKKL